MNIERVELFALRLPLIQPFVTAAGEIAERRIGVLRLTDGEGNFGLGEITPYPHPHGDRLPDYVTVFEQYARPRLTGRPIDATARVLDELGSLLPAQVLAAVDCALLDLQARRLGVPLVELFDRPARARVNVNATLAGGSADEAAERAAAFVADGFKTLKIKVGLPDDRWRVSAVREAAGWDIRLRLDANGAWFSAEAVNNIQDLAQFGVELVEQPVRRDDLAGMHRVRDAVAVPVVADEGVRDAADLRKHIEHHACDGVAVKLSQVGGLSRSHVLADQAERAGMFCIVTSTLDGDVGLAAGLHFAAARPEIDLACGLASHSIFESGYARGLPPVVGGAMAVAAAPGLGIELDDDRLAQLRIDY